MDNELYFSGKEARPQLAQGERFLPESKLKQGLISAIKSSWHKTTLRHPKTAHAAVWTLKTTGSIIAKTCSLTAKGLLKTAKVIKPALPILGKVIVSLATVVGWFALALLGASLEEDKRDDYSVETKVDKNMAIDPNSPNLL
ncbi:hypothetical protein [Motilimonas eburnea]|uniref:hypothetical protein n=1 Tax=Motilimonas eburnea TaxID=1737488 RepID=UPI001E30148F|nr:hypothetical protein [Motilimonas eburnea]MCE2573860.1 hypothetical protein [Motilimonas eburnea]